jgi:hypothetical protein
MLVQPIQIVQNDYGYQLPSTLEDAWGNPANLTGATVSLHGLRMRLEHPKGTMTAKK